jgi:C4-dicarboxylate-specific signal transduction histidine kinase
MHEIQTWTISKQNKSQFKIQLPRTSEDVEQQQTITWRGWCLLREWYYISSKPLNKGLQFPSLSLHCLSPVQPTLWKEQSKDRLTTITGYRERYFVIVIWLKLNSTEQNASWRTMGCLWKQVDVCIWIK